MSSTITPGPSIEVIFTVEDINDDQEYRLDKIVFEGVSYSVNAESNYIGTSGPIAGDVESQVFFVAKDKNSGDERVNKHVTIKFQGPNMDIRPLGES